MKSRNSNGNMTVLVVLSIGIIVVLGVLGLTFDSFLFQRTRAQYNVDAMATSLASKINFYDRVGQMNALVEASRELVYESRSNALNCDQQDMAFASLCNQLVDEARHGYTLVENERRHQIRLITTELQDTALKINARADASRTFGLAWLETSEPKIERVELGHVKNVNSNVVDLGGIEELSTLDQRRDLVQPTSKLFRGDINATLPSTDSALNFKLASLPAYVQGTCAPARNANPDVFVPSASIIADRRCVVGVNLDQLPSAVKLTCTMDAAFGRDRENQASVDLVSTGITNGAIAGGTE